MGQVLSEVVRDFSGGVVTSVLADAVPPNSSPRAFNSSLENIGTGFAVPAKRRGCSTLNATAITGTPIVYQYAYNQVGTTITKYHLLLGANGRLESVSTAGALTSVDTTFFTAFTVAPDWATAKDMAFVVNGTDAKKVLVISAALTAQGFGITAPAAPTVAEGGAGNPSGAYEVALAYYNSNAVHLSSRSPVTTITVTSKQLDVSWSAPADAQVTHVRVYARKTSLSADLFQVTSIAVGTTTYSINLTDAQFNALTTIAPDEDENDAPPSGVKYVEAHAGRLFVADDEKVYYSKIEFPESFDPDANQPINTKDGQKITGLLSVSDGYLLIFKEASTWALIGTDPEGWRLERVLPDVGSVNNLSIVMWSNIVAAWDKSKGPYLWTPEGGPRFIGLERLAPTVGPDTINYAQLALIAAVVDPIHDRLLFSAPDVGQTRNTRLIPYNMRGNVWEAEKWDPIDTASFAVVDDANGRPWVMMGGYAGQVFKLWDATNDGIASGTDTGTVVNTLLTVSTLTRSGTTATATTSADHNYGTGDTVVIAGAAQTDYNGSVVITRTGATTFTYTVSGSPATPATGTITVYRSSLLILEDDAAAYNTTGGGLVERRITLVDSNGRQVGSTRPRISSNTATTVTLATAIAGLASGSTYTYYLGGPAFEWDTYWSDLGAPFSKKRFEFFYVQGLSTSSSVTINIDAAFNFDTAAGQLKALSFDTAAPSAAWDLALWDSAVYGTQGSANKRLRVGRTGWVYRLRVRQFVPDESFTLTKFGVRAELLRDKAS